MPKKPDTKRKTTAPRLIAGLVVLALAAAVLAKNWHTVTESFHVAGHAQAIWFLPALACTALTYVLAAAIYNTLALHPLQYPKTLLVELTTAFVNRLLPAGIGGLGVHGRYLYKHKHSLVEATMVVSANNVLGMLAHFLLLGGVLVVSPSAVNKLRDHFHVGVSVWWLAAILVLLSVLVLAKPLRKKMGTFLRNLLQSFRAIGFPRTVKALLLAMLLTTSYTTVLYISAQAVSLHLSIIQVFIVFSIGMLFSTASPTPGGLVGAEAGLFAGFIGYGASSAAAGASVLLYRLATYWLPLLPGVAALSLARRKRIL